MVHVSADQVICWTLLQTHAFVHITLLSIIIIVIHVLYHTVSYVKLIMFVQHAIQLSYHLLIDKAVYVFPDLSRLEVVAIVLKVKFNQVILAYHA